MLNPDRLITESCKYTDRAGNWIDIQVSKDYRGCFTYSGFAYTRMGNELVFDDLQRQVLRPQHMHSPFALEVLEGCTASRLAGRLADILGKPWVEPLVTHGTPKGVNGILLDPQPVFPKEEAVPPVMPSCDYEEGKIPDDPDESTNPAELEKDFLGMFKSFAPMFGAALKEAQKQMDRLSEFPTSGSQKNTATTKAPEPAPTGPGSVEITTRTDGKNAVSVARMITATSPLKIGSHGRSGLCLDDPQVSRVHAYIERESDGLLRLIDLGSGRGTFVNGEKITKRVLAPGDTITVGNTSVTIKDHGI